LNNTVCVITDDIRLFERMFSLTREPSEVTPRVWNESHLFKQNPLRREGFLPMRFPAGVITITLDFLLLTRYVWKNHILVLCESDISRRNCFLWLKLLRHSNDFKSYLWTKYEVKIRLFGFFIHTVPIVKKTNVMAITTAWKRMGRNPSILNRPCLKRGRHISNARCPS
jgi:hypothetical protein